MREAIYDWMKNIAVFYIFVTAISHMVPGKGYDKYIRYFTGMLLLLLLALPVLRILQMDESMEGYVQRYLEEAVVREEENLAVLSSGELLEKGTSIQEEYFMEEYQKRELEEIRQTMETMGEEIISMQMAEGKLELVFEGEENQLRKEEILSELKRVYNLGEENIRIIFRKDGEEAVAGTASGGSASGSHYTAGETK